MRMKESDNPSDGITRGEFMWIMLGLATAAAVKTGQLFWQSEGPNSNNYGRQVADIFESKLDSAFEGYKRFFKQNYGIDVTTIERFEDRYNAEVTRANKYEQVQVLQILSEEVIKYPPAFFNSNGIHTIRILSHLSWPENQPGMITKGFVVRGENAINILARGVQVDLRRNMIRDCFHHETFHAAEFARRGSLNLEEWRLADTSTLNHALFYPENNTDYYLRPEEYRAWFAAYLMDPIKHIRLLKTIITIEDPEKREYHKMYYRRMLDSFSLFSDRRMTGKYWDDLLAGQVGPDYFEK